MIEVKYLLTLILILFLFSYFQGYLEKVQHFLKSKGLPFRTKGRVILTNSTNNTKNTSNKKNTKGDLNKADTDREWIKREIQKNVDDMEKESDKISVELIENYNKEKMEKEETVKDPLNWKKVQHIWKKLNPFSSKEIEKFSQKYTIREALKNKPKKLQFVDTNDPLGKNYTRKHAKVHFNQESFVSNCDDIFDPLADDFDNDDIPIDFTPVLKKKQEGMYSLDWLDGYNVKESNVFESRWGDT